MNRWAARIVGLIMVLIFSLVFVQLYKTLKLMERQQQSQSAPQRP